MANEQNNAAAAQETITGQIAILKIYVKDLSIENPDAPQVFQQENMPNVEMNLRSEAKKITENTYESVLTVTLTFKREEKTVLLVEVAQAGIFAIKGIPEAAMQQLLSSHCPSVLFPYARQVASSAVGYAGFPPFYLPPTNLEALYQQQMEAQQEEANSTVN
ncbi:MAG: protein-export chaperone SecB [Burkholderiales bacterium]|jgi:preprotein translocase subunit SecB|nr:protein-export chaperone SecB [Burkholderiales bacterium]